jgi:hypothetical protein
MHPSRPSVFDHDPAGRRRPLFEDRRDDLLNAALDLGIVGKPPHHRHLAGAAG